MLVPRVKHEKSDGKPTHIPLPISVWCEDEIAEQMLFVLNEMMPYGGFFALADRQNATVTLQVALEMFEKKEAYSLQVKNGRVAIAAKDLRGMINAIATLSQLFYFENGALFAKNTEIFDYPSTSYRSFMPDPARSLIPLDDLKIQILTMARAKLNKLHLHLNDSIGFCFQSEKFPSLMRSPGGAYTKAELVEIVLYAQKFGIDVVPEIDVPAHGFAITASMPELKCKVTDGQENAWDICIGNEATYLFLQSLLEEICTVFPYEYIHIGTDEIAMNDIFINEVHYMPDWDRCEVCNRLFSSLNITDLREKFYYFVRRMYKIVTSLGRKMMMWNDNIDISVSPDLPRDILIQFWRVAAPHRGPVEGCSMERFLEERFHVVNAHYKNAYLDRYITWEKLKKWEPTEGTNHPFVLGGEMCAWGDNDHVTHYRHALPVALLCFGDRLYHSDTIENETEFLVALTRGSLGCDVPCDFNLFDHLVTVPLGDKASCEGKIFVEHIDKTQLKGVLDSLKHQSADQKGFCEALIDLM